MAGIKFEAEGYGEFQKTLNDLKSSLKVLGSEMKVVKSEFDKDDTSVAALTAKNKALNSSIEKQKELVNHLAKGVAEATTEFGENDKRTQDLTIQYNKAKASLNGMEREVSKNKDTMRDYCSSFLKLGSAIDDAEDDAKDFASELKSVDKHADECEKSVNGLGKETRGLGNDLENTGKKSGIFGEMLKANLTSEAIIGGIKAIGGTVKELGQQFASIVKESVENYGDYEQLVGGVETLFSESSGAVVKYANDAYKTAGLSANDYMETVTGFSASLLQSLGGDTAKATEYANMAVTDMSDNANKMGTDMASIQNAYQGFAKQNFTMLDNLKLGYGGTKEEMKRLLEDAEKLSGVKYDISSYSDIVDAIHVVQTEMGVTGTTAKEAESTIQGSFASMKAAWENFLTGMADPEQDFDALVNNLVDSVVTFGENIVPLIQNLLPRLVDGFAALVDGLIPYIAPTLETLLSSIVEGMATLAQSIADALPDILEVLSNAVPMIVESLVEMLPLVVETGLEIVVALANGIADSLPELIPAVANAVVLIVETLIDHVDELIDAAIAIIEALANGLIQALPVLIEKAPEIIVKLVSALIENGPKILDAGVELTKILAKGLLSALSSIVDVGKNLVEGLWNGIKGATQWLLGKIKEWCGSILNGIKSFFGIHSPSTVMAEVGKYMLEGLAIGMQDQSGKLMQTVDDISKELLARLSSALGVFSISSDVSGLQYDLWESTVGKTATSDEKSKKKLESLNEQAKLQEQQIDTTKKAYAKMVDLYGVEGEESLKLQKQLLQEQLAYEKLKKSIDEVANAKSNVNADKLANLAEQEYKLWFLNTPDATDVEKLEKQSDVLTYKLDLQTQSVSDTEAAFADAAKQYGVNSDESIKLQDQLLKEKIAYAELKKQIDEVTKALSQYGIVRDMSKISSSFSGLKSAAYDTAPQQLSAQAVGGMISNAVNALGTMNGGQQTVVVQNPLYINGREFARATVDDFRVVEASSPQVRSDRF